MALSQIEARGDRIVLTQEFREDEYYNESAVAVGLAGAMAEIADETEIRLTAPAPGRPFTILIASAASFDKQTSVVDLAVRQLDAAASRGVEQSAVRAVFVEGHYCSDWRSRHG